MFNFAHKIKTVLHHPSIIKSIIYRKRLDEIRAEILANLDKIDYDETSKFITYMKQNNPYSLNSNTTAKLKRLCSLEDWDNDEIRQTISELHKSNPPVIIHRKNWEFAMGIIAMKRFNKLNMNSLAAGVGSGVEPIPFYLANRLKHVYATDLYGEIDEWSKQAPSTFINYPKKMHHFHTKKMH